MNLLDAKVIQTELEKEIFIDLPENLELKRFQYHGENRPHFEILVGVIMGRVRNWQFYGKEKVYFGLRATDDLQALSIFDPGNESIFAARYGKEEDTVIEFIDYILMESPAFKHLLENVISKAEAPNKVKMLLEKLLNLQPGDIQFKHKETEIVTQV
ncbi:hypothetical protein PU629_12265 [Pullulanibacillus sp. KACC 23026]|uniref:hypothetical protein n=1 Tax=Pullulanibacillus sp. KACC 23026 TaxID=3028315 RepID=UPI0023AFC398|nr:hypothetical protein [Pullulanibacillus sp. KACC 23026]WEG10951.1 hypothetical protein PU629_12265 [Pullulanibacillus sp. KACC 23026]